MYNIIVCLKQVPDPEAPSSVYSIDETGSRVICKVVPPVISTYDENALEAGLRIKDIAECRITVISAGKSLSKPVLKKSLAAGADELILLDSNAFADMDGYTTAIVIGEAVKRFDQYDLILTGMQSADTNAGVVGIYIAELLNVPCLSYVRRFSLDGLTVSADSLLSDGWRTMQATLPAVITIHKSLGDLRMATAACLAQAAKKPLTIWTEQDLQLKPSALTKTKLLHAHIPHREPCVEMITGAGPEEIGQNLADKLFSIGAIKK